MSQSVPPAGEAPDVVRIMKEIRESIQRKRAQGIYTDEEVESLTSLRLRAYGEEARIDGKLLERLLGPTHDWNIATDYLIRTQRTGPSARALVLAKKLVRPFVRLYTDHLLNRQAQINLYLAHLLHNNVRETARLQVELQALRHRVKVLEGMLSICAFCKKIRNEKGAIINSLRSISLNYSCMAKCTPATPSW